MVFFENMYQVLHRDQTYTLSTLNNNTRMKGPPEVEAKYPQKWGM